MTRRKKNLTPRPIAPDCAWPPARIAALRRKTFKKLNKLRASKELQNLLAKEAAGMTRRSGGADVAHEKAPGLATEGSIFFKEKETPSG